MKTGNALLNHIPTLISLWRKSDKSSPLVKNELEILSKSLLNLQRGLTGDRKLAGGSYMSDKNLFGAYLLYYFPVSYIQIQTILDSIEENVKKIAQDAESENKTIRILEIGSGPAPGTVAICDRIRKFNSKVKIEIVLSDSSKNALETASKVLKKDFENIEVVTNICNLEKRLLDKLGMKKRSTTDTTTEEFSILNSQFSIILMSHVLNELWKTDSKKIEKRIEFLKNVKNILSDDGILILNEPAVLEASRNLIKVRDEILNNEEFNELDLIAPCQFSKSSVVEALETTNSCCPCLISENQTCHAEKMWKPIEPILSMAKNAKLDRQSVKMTYFVFKMKDENGKMKNTDITKPDVTQQFFNSQFSIFNSLVVSDGMLNKSGRVRFMLCDGKKRFSLSAKKDDSHAKEIGFFNLSRYDKIEIKNPEKREENFGIKEDTEIIKK